jgi:hypothetical protein
MDRPSPEIVDCPHCGARNLAIDDDCAAGGRGLTLYIGPWAKVRRVGLGSVMMGVAVVAVCLAPVRVTPGLCILLACILLPATTRAILHIEGRKQGRGAAHEPGRDGPHRRLYRRRGRRTIRHLPAGPATLASQGLTP